MENKPQKKQNKKQAAPSEKKTVRELKTISIQLAYYLRHGALEHNIKIDLQGYVLVTDLIGKEGLEKASVDIIKHIVANDEKKRYNIKEAEDGKLYIRAVQGHSIKTLDHESMLTRVFDPSALSSHRIVHGTFSQFLDLIMQTGLKTMSRNHIHFAMGYPEDALKENSQVISGVRKGCDVYIELDVELALASGVHIFVSANNVVLTDGINQVLPPLFFKKVFKVNQNGDLDLIFTNQDLAALKTLYCPRYLFVLDFEANCLETEVLNPQEIIEFPVVIVDTHKHEILENKIFHHYVKPKHFLISEFCTSLTGITQATVDAGIYLEEVLQKFEEFLQTNSEFIGNFVFATCGDWDLRSCLSKEAKFKKIQLPPYFKQYINIKTVYSKYFDVPGKFGMVQMLEKLKLPLVGHHHSGIDDSKNLAKILVTMLKDPKFLIPKAYINQIK